MRALALNTGPDFHLLDHIAPLADLLNIPLITTEEKNFELAKTFYPKVKVNYLPDLEFRLKELAESYDMLVECKYWKPQLKQLFQELYQKDMKLVFCPHGQSDKGFGYPLLLPYADQDAVLIYGPLMKEMLYELKIQPKQTVVVGNYRKTYYQNNKTFYDKKLKETIQLDLSKRTLLYAPTWKDADGIHSFFDYGLKVINDLPDDWNLILKIHPLLEQRNLVQYIQITKHIEKKKNAFLLESFPPVYPVLGAADVYLGDFSSVGYDFLGTQKPLFFLPTNNPSRIYSCGQMLVESENIYSQLESPNRLEEKQQELYRHAFSESTQDIFTQLAAR